jgi:hypothetical protein
MDSDCELLCEKCKEALKRHYVQYGHRTKEKKIFSLSIKLAKLAKEISIAAQEKVFK